MNKNEMSYDEILNLIKSQLIEIMEENYNYYKNYNLILAKEQDFIKSNQIKPNNIYMVVKFSSASVNFGQTVLPINITAMSESNGSECCHRLLLDYVHKYNLIEGDYLTQLYESPVITSNFNKVFDGYRSLIQVRGYFIISRTANPATISYKNEKVPLLSLGLSVSFQLDSQPFYDSFGYTKSETKFGTLNFSITTYMLSDIPLLNEIIEEMILEKKTEFGDVNKKFIFDLKFKKNDKVLTDSFRLVNLSYQGNIGEIPLVTLSFAN